MPADGAAFSADALAELYRRLALPAFAGKDALLSAKGVAGGCHLAPGVAIEAKKVGAALLQYSVLMLWRLLHS